MIQHILTTRFNVKTLNSRNKQPDISWLYSRLALFKEITIPSIINQTILPDFWFVFFDVNTPVEIKESITHIINKYDGLFIACYVDFFSCTTVKNVLAEYLPKNTDWLVSTRLDNDDALNNCFIETIQKNVKVGHLEFINITSGLIITSNKAYSKNDYSNPFISLSEPFVGFETVWVKEHHRVSSHAPIKQLQLKHGWIQCVHGGNIANQVRGVRVKKENVSESVSPHLIQHVKHVNFIEYLIDNTIFLLKRYSGSLFRRIKTELNDW